LSKPIDAGDQQKLTQTGLFLGTPVFSSPEQLIGESLDVRSDIYAVGVTFYSMLTGKLPYQSGSMMQVVASVLNGVPAPITNFRGDLPQPVIDVVMKAMARKADDRYQDYSEFRSAVAALRVETLLPATLWDRFRASAVDWVVNFALVAIVSVLFLPGSFWVGNGRASDWRQVVASFVVTLLVVGIPEALRGQSIGKWLVGIRVTGPDDTAPGFAREAGRILLLAISDFATVTVQIYAASLNSKASITFLTMLVCRGVLLLSVRRSNGWRMLHDILTGTRVSRTRATTEQRRGEAHRAAVPTLSGNESRVGPYAITGNVTADGTILSGWDAAMHRTVWIIPRPADAPEATAGRRILSRLTRLRWVGGRRAANDSWDAFEAPIGRPLGERLAEPVRWSVQQNWLLDISDEMIAAQTDGTALHGLSVDSIWVTPTDRLVFPEGNDAATTHAAATTSNVLVGQLFDRIQAARTTFIPLPGYAIRTIASARSTEKPEQIRALVQGTLGRPLGVTRARRAAMIMATLAPIMLFAAIGWFSSSQAVRLDPASFKMASLASFVADSADANPDSVRKRAAAATANPRVSKRIARAMESIGILPVFPPDTITSPDTLRKQRRLAEVYLSSVMADRVRDTVTQSSFGRTEREKRARVSILARNPVIDSGEARAARQLVDSVWKGAVPGADPGNITKFIPYVLAVSVILLGAAVSVVSGLLVRRGPLLRGFQLDLMTATGAPASRIRLLIRNVVIWSVALTPIPAMILAPRLSIAALGTMLIASAAVFAAAWAAAVWLSMHTPSRGLAERISGTWLVPE
ncbi:MAG: RDD family protein, partial [Gemmatimonadaceae bacterium]